MSSNKNKAALKQGNQKKKLVGRGDYNVTSKEFAELEAHLSRLERKLPDVKAGLGAVGGRLGGLLGSSELGRQAGLGISKILGFGDYDIKTNSLMKSTGGGPHVPMFTRLGDNGIRVAAREYIGDIVSGPTGTFALESYPIQPTNSRTFPWLSNVATLFDQWEPMGIVFEYVSTSSDFNGSAQGLGTVILATDYNATDASYPNKRVMENADYSSSGKPSMGQFHGVECDPAQRPTKLLFTQPVTVGEVNNQYTLGNFQVASAGVSAAGVTLGELWVSYDITFFKKQLNPQRLLGGSWYGNATSTAWFSNLTFGPTSGGFRITQGPTPSTLRLYFPAGLFPAQYQLTIAYADTIAASIWAYGSSSWFNLTSAITRTGGSTSKGATMGAYNVFVTGPNAYHDIQGPNFDSFSSIGVQQVFPGYNW